MKKRVYSFRDWPLASSLMGYAPQLHLFQWISLVLSAGKSHVTACNREVMGKQGFKRWRRSSLISWILLQLPFRNQTSPLESSSSGGGTSWKTTKGFRDERQAKRPDSRTCCGFSLRRSSVKYSYFSGYKRVTEWKIPLAIPFHRVISAH